MADAVAEVPSGNMGEMLKASMIRLNEEANDSAAQLRQIGRMSVSQAQENANRLSAMFGVRAAQANPVEATAINSLKASEAGGNAQNNAIAASLMTLVSALANLAHVTPATQQPPSQANVA